MFQLSTDFQINHKASNRGITQLSDKIPRGAGFSRTNRCTLKGRLGLGDGGERSSRQAQPGGGEWSSRFEQERAVISCDCVG